jgi:hypothetical protein
MIKSYARIHKLFLDKTLVIKSLGRLSEQDSFTIRHQIRLLWERL